jgi:hypothetical protein
LTKPLNNGYGYLKLEKGMITMDYTDKVKQLLEEMMAVLESKPNRETTSVLDGSKAVLTKEEFLYITDWDEKNYQKRDNQEKKNALLKHGIVLHEIEGRGKYALIHVTLKANFFRFWLLKEDFLKEGKEKEDIHEFAYSEIAEKYVMDVFLGKGYLDLGGAPILALLDEYADQYARMFNKSHSSAKNIVNRVRTIMNEKGYLLRGKKSYSKQKRVMKKGETTYLQGPDAVRIAKQIDIAYAANSKEMEETIPFSPEDTRKDTIDKMMLRRKRRKEYTNYLKEKYGLERIYNNYGSTLSDRAELELNNIIALFSAGASLEQIDCFLKQTFAFWKEEQSKQEAEIQLRTRALLGDKSAIEELERIYKDNLEKFFAILDLEETEKESFISGI